MDSSSQKAGLSLSLTIFTGDRDDFLPDTLQCLSSNVKNLTCQLDDTLSLKTQKEDLNFIFWAYSMLLKSIKRLSIWFNSRTIKNLFLEDWILLLEGDKVDSAMIFLTTLWRPISEKKSLLTCKKKSPTLQWTTKTRTKIMPTMRVSLLYLKVWNTKEIDLRMFSLLKVKMSTEIFFISSKKIKIM